VVAKFRVVGRLALGINEHPEPFFAIGRRADTGMLGLGLGLGRVWRASHNGELSAVRFRH
jgi:hypothetical protein